MLLKRLLKKMFEVPGVDGNVSAALCIMKSVIIGGVAMIVLASLELRSEHNVNITMILVFIAIIVMLTALLYLAIYCAPPKLKEVMACSFYIMLKLGSLEAFIVFCMDGLLLLCPSLIILEWGLLSCLSMGILKLSLAGASGIYEIMRVGIAIYVQQYKRTLVISGLLFILRS